MTDIVNSIATENVGQVPSAKSLLGQITNIASEELTKDNLKIKLSEMIQAITSDLDADHGYIIMEDQNGKLENIASVFFKDQDEEMVTMSNALVDHVFQDGQGLIITDAMNNKLFPADPNFQRFNICTAICAPIKCSQTTFGAIYCDSKNNQQWGRTHLETLRLLGLFIGISVNRITISRKCEENRRLAAAGHATLKMSHSVKNILQMVAGAAEVMDFGLRTNEIHRVKRSWDILKPNLERLRKFTMDMLDYSKERKLELGPCDFNRVIQGAIESLKSQLKQKKSKLNIRIDQHIPIIELDNERIHEMALNLILNAIDIVDQNSGVVNIATKYHPDLNAVELIVADNGPGMTDDMKGKIFEPFESDKNKFGTGLGMPIAKQVIDQHNGEIEIESELGKGTTFRVFMPAKPIQQ